MCIVVCEKVTRDIDLALCTRQPLIIVCCSGGTRMTESASSLMQLASVSAALVRKLAAPIQCTTAKFGLQNITILDERLGRPARAYPSAHIAGTNGKGSTAAFLEAILRCFFSSRGRHTRFDCDWSSDVCSSDLMFFFFSSRRRHTRFDCDWSSDVCSSDLMYARAPYTVMQRAMHIHPTVSELLPTMLGELEPLALTESSPKPVKAAAD